MRKRDSTPIQQPVPIRRATYDMLSVMDPLFARFLKETGEIRIVDEKPTRGAQQPPARVSPADVAYYKTLFPPAFVEEALKDGTLELKEKKIVEN